MTEKIEFKRKGLIYRVKNNVDWMISHSQVPFAMLMEDNIVRFYFATRDNENRSTTTFVDAEASNPKNIKYIHNAQCIGLGRMGTFDDYGAMPSWFIRHEDKIYLYYSGWNIGVNVSYRMGIGLAISYDNGLSFKRISEAPILDRSEFDPCWCAQPCVAKDGDKWKMWYLSCTKWEIIDNHPEPFYNVKYAISDDGIEWRRTGDVCLDYDEFTNAIGRPSVMQRNGIYEMYYSYRSASGYRIDPSKAYRIGYATSKDGINFEKKNQSFEISGKREGWESIMNEYCHLYRYGNKLFLIYNGNGFGESGFGYAVLNDAKL